MVVVNTQRIRKQSEVDGGKDLGLGVGDGVKVESLVGNLKLFLCTR